jgi:D-serine deaminase-like pyridoxal phosphate-dependent protein
MEIRTTFGSAAALDTPAVTILLDRLEANIARVQRIVAGHGIALRPHIKTHKIPAIAKMQLAAGASGITCQKLGEVEAFVDEGVDDDILITFNIVGEAKTERLARLAKRVRHLSVVLDNDAVARGISSAARAAGVEIPFLVECDTGFGRNGVATPGAALDLGTLAMKMPGLRFEGLMTYPNRPETATFFTEALALFRRAGLDVPVVSGGGTPALGTIGNFPMLTEHRAGTYVYNDVLIVSAGAATWDDCAMYVRATVVSRPAPERAVIDAGSKVLTREQYSVKNFGRVVEYPDAVVVNLNEEHGVIDLSASATKPDVGEVINVIPNHCCVVSNMVDEVYGIRGGAVEVVWPVAARGKVR